MYNITLRPSGEEDLREYYNRIESYISWCENNIGPRSEYGWDLGDDSGARLPEGVSITLYVRTIIIVDEQYATLFRLTCEH